MDIEREMRVGEMEATIMAQRHARQVAKNELLRMQKRTTELTNTVMTLADVIKKGEAELAEMQKVVQ